MQSPPTSPNPEASEVVSGALAQFDGPAALVAAAARVREAGYTRWDAHSPFPVHGLDRAMGIRPTILPWLVLGAGIAGGIVAILLQWWTNAFDYPHVISGKPLFSLPANIPIAFELIVLFSALTAFLGVLVLNLLPQFWHMVFGSPRFSRATTDGFLISIEAADPRFDEAATLAWLEFLGASSVEICRATTAGRELPKAIYWAGVVAIVLAPLPILLIARAREVQSTSPRIHIIQDMDFQPKYKMQAASPLFADGRAMRLPVPGTIAEGQLEVDDHLERGLVGGKWAATFPMPVTRAMIERGRERYGIYCATCHGLGGDGDGMTHLRALKRGDAAWVPPSDLSKPAIRSQPVGQILHTTTHGVQAKGALTMPAYASQIPVADRWAIVLYVRALQRSQNATLKDIPAEEKSRLTTDR